MPSEIKYPYNCLMIQFKFPNWMELNESIVPNEDLYEDEPGYSREDEPHCTLLY